MRIPLALVAVAAFAVPAIAEAIYLFNEVLAALPRFPM